MKIVAVCGSSKSGKTTTVVEIVKELRLRGYSVATIKNIHADDFVFDTAGKDTWRHWKAGAEVVGLRAPTESILMIKRSMTLDELISHIHSDYLVLEGFRGTALPKVLCATDEKGVEGELQDTVFCISGVVSAQLSAYKGIPVINALLNVAELVDLVERRSLKL
ncbi:MAG: molybdopterin-guanine dinucleotide biosynthesis protein B [Halobacteriota archaeon]|jgi:molybdopterin-guanine dinucleotide biosynthesis protein B